MQQFVGAIGLRHREAERLVQAARYHDLGKIAIDEATLSKSGRLTEGELRAIRRHPRLSAKLLQPFGFAREIARYAELHHERYDGRGYYAVPAYETATEAHVLIVADSFDAMTSIRAYRPALTAHEAMQELLDKAGTQFHPLVARAFVAVLQGRDVREALTAEELAQLVGSFERISALPRLNQSTLREARVGLVCLVGVAMIGLTLTPSGLPRLGTLDLAAIGISVLGARTLRQRQRELRAIRRIRRGASIESALAAGGIAADARWMWWDADADTYQIDGSDDRDEEIVARASLAANADAIRLSDGRYLVVKARTPEHALAALLAKRPTRYEIGLVEKIAAQADAPAQPTTRTDARRSGDATSRTLVLIAKLHAFERIRAGAGQLTAARVVRDAKLAVDSCLRSTDSVTISADDQLVISLGDVPDAEIDRLCQRLATELTQVQVPKRVDPISATFDVTWRSHPTQDGDPRGLRLAG